MRDKDIHPENLQGKIPASKPDVFLNEVIQKIADSESGRTITIIAPDRFSAELAESHLKSNGYKVSSYQNVLNVDLN